VRWEELAGRDLIVLHTSSPVQQLVDAELARHSVAPASKLAVNQLETVIAFAEAGLGVGVVPSFARAACRRYAVSTTTLTPAVEFRFHRITRAGHRASPALDAFTSLFATIAAELDETAVPKAASRRVSRP
jgi:DNA-binding transcriptional LysR family regulator